MTSRAERLLARPLWQLAALSAGAGAVAAMGQVPFHQPVLMAFALAAVFYAAPRAPDWRRASVIGWGFGLGYFALALSWIVEPFLVDIARHGWMAPFALVFMSGGLALFWAAAFALARYIGSVWALAIAWPLAELARAYVFTGFPWAMFPQALIDTPAAQGLAWLGPHGMMLALCLVMAALVWRVWSAVPAALVIAVGLFGPWQPVQPTLTEHMVRVVQPNAPQHEKFDPTKIPEFNRRLLEATAAGTPPALVVWPEIAVPYLLEQADPFLAQVAFAGRGAPVILGIQRRNAEGRSLNAMAVVNGAAEVTGVYDKYHLVPFGEYIPFASFFAQFGIRGLATADLRGYAQGPGPALLDLGPLGPALPLICYEAVFAHRVNAAPARPRLLLHITNDAWFGTFAGPQQHFAQARMRAIEQGLPVVRSANTGISGIIGPRGHVLAQLPLGAAGYAQHLLPTPLAPTLYSQLGDLPVAILLVFATFLTTGMRILIDARRGWT